MSHLLRRGRRGRQRDREQGMRAQILSTVLEAVRSGHFSSTSHTRFLRYVTLRIQNGDAHNISCPSYDCAKLVPLDLIESVVSPTVARKYLTFDIKVRVAKLRSPSTKSQAFVESNPCIQWCPHPGCTSAVQLPYLEADGPPTYMRMFPKCIQVTFAF